MHKQKFLAVLLTAAMAVSMMSSVAYAADLSNPEQITQSEVSAAQEDPADSSNVSENDPTNADQPSAETEPAEEVNTLSSEQTADPQTAADSNDGKEAAAQDPEADSEEETDAEKVTEEAVVAPAPDYGTFLSSLKVLEGYASDYALANGGDATALVLNYIRTGIEKYNTDSWATLAGAENTAFVKYVAQRDTEKGTTAQAVRGIEPFNAPDGTKVDLPHMFATMDLTYYNNKAQTTLDYGGWAGDIVDLMSYSNGKVSATDVEAMSAEILEKYMASTDDTVDSFDLYDFRGDLDAYYLITNMTGGKTISSLMEGYFTGSLTDAARAEYFAKNRFADSKTKDALREAVCTAYQGNSGVSLLEADRGLTSLSDLRTASCYAFADYIWKLAGDKIGGNTADNPFYTVFSSENSTLAPGVEQNISYALTADDKQIVYYTATVDVSRDDVQIYANYRNNDASSWGMARVTDQIAAAKAKHSDPDSEGYIANYTPVLGVNADFYNMTNGVPSGALVMEGKEYSGVGNENFFAILKDGTPIIGGSSEYAAYKDQIQEAVGASIYLVKDGKVAVSTSANYYNNRASRTCVGITADGKVVFMALDGRQEPFSAGGSAEEIAQIMLDAGCVTAVNLDGGGSTTFAAKEEGADDISVVNRPSDGYERSVSSSLMVVSTAKSSNTFDHAIVSTDTDYLTVGASMNISAVGVSISGGTADLPDGAKLVVSDESIATLSDGVLTGIAKGDVTVSIVADGVTYGSKILHVVTPDGLKFTKDSMNAVYGSSVVMPLEATYNGNPVTICANDITFSLSTSSAGKFDGLSFVGDESSGVRVVTVTAQLTRDLSISDKIEISLYKNGEAVFDFNNATAGDEQLAWNRNVTNSTTDDKTYYHAVDPTQPMDISYIFALDMTTVPVPDKIKPLLSLIPGGDSENVRAWDMLLQLAERVGQLTNVTFNIKFDENLDIDYSGLTLVNDYFSLTSTSFDDETNTLTIICNWKKQTQAISPDTANPIVILSGIKAVPKDSAKWDKNECLAINNGGDLSYDIYLRSNTLYSVASQSSVQENYGIYPYSDDRHPYNGSAEMGGHFATTYKTFSDAFTLDKSSWNGWKKSGDDLYYYVNNKAVTGIQYVPGYEDESSKYYYTFDENGVCKGKVTGLFDLDGAKYYAVNGERKTGWRLITKDGKDNYYYFDEKTGKAVDGKQKIKGYNYVFTDCILTQGEWIKDSTGTRYMWAGAFKHNCWFTVDGKDYYARPNTYIATGAHYNDSPDGSTKNIYYFDENGVWMKDYSGFYDYNGSTYLMKNGATVQHAGLIQMDGAYYYINSSNKVVKDCDYYISLTNDLMPRGTYHFDKDGKMVIKEEPEPEVKNGLVEESGELYYYVNGARTHAGLIQVDGAYYYINSSCKAVRNCDYYVSNTNNMMPKAYYHFDENGKMVIKEEPEPEVKNGLVNESGELYYYVNGVRTHAGLIQVDGAYYYINSSCKAVRNCDYYVSNTNNLMPKAYYHFDENGKMIISKN